MPVHEELKLLAEMEVVSIDSLNVTTMVVPNETEVVPSAGDTALTDGVVVSGALPVVNPEEVSYWKLIDVPELSFTSDVTRIL